MSVLLLPYPPSVNRLWRFAGSRMYRTKVYRDWAEDAQRHAAAQKPIPTITGPVSLDLAVGRPDRRRRDLDNVNKAVLDLLQHIEVLEDDSLVHKLVSYWDEDTIGVRVAIYPMDQADDLP